MVTGSTDMIAGRVFDPDGDLVDAIHVYRDADGNGVIDLGIDQLLHADTTPGDGFSFKADSLASGPHVLHVAAMKNGAVVGSSANTLVAARWWTVSLSTHNHGTASFTTTGEPSRGLVLQRAVGLLGVVFVSSRGRERPGIPTTLGGLRGELTRNAPLSSQPEVVLPVAGALGAGLGRLGIRRIGGGPGRDPQASQPFVAGDGLGPPAAGGGNHAVVR